VKQGNTRIEATCGKCGAPNRVSAAKARPASNSPASNAAHQQETFENFSAVAITAITKPKAFPVRWLHPSRRRATARLLTMRSWTLMVRSAGNAARLEPRGQGIRAHDQPSGMRSMSSSRIWQKPRHNPDASATAQAGFDDVTGGPEHPPPSRHRGTSLSGHRSRNLRRRSARS